MLAHSIVYITKKGALIINVRPICVFGKATHHHWIQCMLIQKENLQLYWGGEDSSFCIVGECTLAKIIQQSFSISVLSQVPIDKYACTISNLCAPVTCALSDCSYVRIATVFSCIVLVSKLSMQLSACLPSNANPCLNQLKKEANGSGALANSYIRDFHWDLRHYRLKSAWVHG